MEEPTELQESKELVAANGTDTAEFRRGPGWTGWVLSILVAILLSVTATLLLGGSGAFRSESEIGVGGSGGVPGAGHTCCPPANFGK